LMPFKFSSTLASWGSDFFRPNRRKRGGAFPRIAKSWGVLSSARGIHPLTSRKVGRMGSRREEFGCAKRNHRGWTHSSKSSDYSFAAAITPWGGYKPRKKQHSLSSESWPTRYNTRKLCGLADGRAYASIRGRAHNHGLEALPTSARRTGMWIYEKFKGGRGKKFTGESRRLRSHLRDAR